MEKYLNRILSVHLMVLSMSDSSSDSSGLTSLTIHNLLDESRITGGSVVNTVRKFFPETWIWDLLHTEWVYSTSFLNLSCGFLMLIWILGRSHGIYVCFIDASLLFPSCTMTVELPTLYTVSNLLELWMTSILCSAPPSFWWGERIRAKSKIKALV